LTPAEGQELALALLKQGDAVAHARAAEIARESGGNPFFVYELVEHLQDDPSATGANATATDVRLTLTDVLWKRILRLPAEQRRLLEVMAVAGRPLREVDACQAADWPAVDLSALAQLRSVRLVRSTGTAEQQALEIYHDRIRETIVVHLTAEVLGSAHRRLAVVLEAAGQYDPEALAIHFQGANEAARAGHYYAQAAAQAAEALAFDRAAKLYRLALELFPEQQQAEERLRVKLADALANAGRGAESAREYLAAAAGASSAELLELQRRAALQFLISGHVDDGLATLRTVLEAVQMPLPRTMRQAFWSLVLRRLQVRLRGLGFRPRPMGEVPPEELNRVNICWSASVGLSMVSTIQGAYYQTRSLLLALHAGEPYHLARALALEAAHVSTGGSHARKRTARLLQAANDLARQVNQPYIHALVELAEGIAADLAGDWPRGRELCDRAEETLRTRCTGVVWELDTAQRFALWPLMFMGDVPEIARRLPRLIKEAQERDDLYAVTNLSLVIRPFLRLAANEPERARAELQQVMQNWSQQGFHVQHMNRMHDETHIDLYLGDGPAAWARLEEHWPTLGRLHFLRVQQVRIFLLHLRARSALAAAAQDAGQRQFYLDAAEKDARALDRERIAWATALAQLIRAGLACRRGDTARAVRLLRESATSYDALTMRLHAAAARLRLGDLLGGEEGHALQTAAVEWMSAQTIQDPKRMTDMLAPGFPGPC
jgi:hypothetical protein